jgi:hypothetical protein
MRSHIQDGAFTDLRLGRRRENEIDFKVLRSMERWRNQMKRTVGLISRDHSMIIERELTAQIR